MGEIREMARLPSLEKMSYADLLDARDQIDAAIADRKAIEARETKAKLRDLAEKAGFTLEELFGGRRRGAATVKYRNPKSPDETWVGRGRKPTWLVDALKKGAKIESFEV